MITSIDNHDFLESDMKENGLVLNQIRDMLISNTAIFGLDISKSAISKIPFIDQTSDPKTMSVDKPTFVGYSSDVWLVVPKTGGGSDAYNMTSILKSGVISTINGVKSDSSGEISFNNAGDLIITNDPNSNSITLDSSNIDAKITSNTALAQQGVNDAKDAYDRAVSAVNTANTAIITAQDSKTTADNAVVASALAQNSADDARNRANTAQAGVDTNKTSIDSLTPRVTKTEADIFDNQTKISTNASNIATNSANINLNKVAITSVSTKAVETITSSDASITVVKSGNTVDLKAVGGGGGGGTVKSVDGKTPKANGDIDIEDSPSISPTTSSSNNSLKFKVNISKTAGNSISVNSDGIFSSGGGTPSPSGVSTIDGNQPVNNNYDLVMLDNSLSSDSTEDGKTKLKVKVNPDADNIIRVSPTGIKATGTKVTASDQSIVITPNPSDDREIGVSVGLDPAGDNILKKNATGLYAKGTSGHSHQEENTLYYDDTYAGGDDDGSFEKPYASLATAVTTAMSHTASSGKQNTIKSRDTASYTIGAGETYKLGSATEYVGMQFNFPDKKFAGTIQIDFDGKTTDGLDTIEVRCHDFSGAFDVVNEGTVASTSDQHPPIYIYLNCNFKNCETDRQQFGIDATGITGISKKLGVYYNENIVDAIIEGSSFGDTSDINCILPDSFTNFTFEANCKIGSVETGTTSGVIIPPVNYINIRYTGTNHPTLSTEITVFCPDEGLRYTFTNENADENTLITKGLITADMIKATNIQSKTGVFDGQVVLSNTVNPTVEGGIAYDKTDKAILVKTDTGIIKLSEMSSDNRAKIVASAKRVTFEDIIETNYEKKSIFLPRGYISTFDDNTDIATNIIEIDTAEIGIRRKDITYNSGQPNEIIYPKNLLMDTHDFATNPKYHGLAYFKMASVSSVSILDAGDPNLNLNTINLNIGGGLDEPSIRDLLREGFVYSLQAGTTGRLFAFILYDIISVDALSGAVVLRGFSNITATTNIPVLFDRPYANIGEVQTAQTGFDSLYFGDTVDFVFNKSLFKAKARESIFPQYFPVIMSSNKDVNKQSITLVPFNSRMLVSPTKTNRTIGNKALINKMLPKAFIKFFADKWGTTVDQISYQTVGLPLMLGIIDDIRDSILNNCREFMPAKIYTADNNFKIKYYSGNGGTVTAKFQQTTIFGDAKSKWTGLNKEDILADSENYISSFVQDCAYINELEMVMIPEKSLSTGKYSGFTQASATVIKGNREVFTEARDLITEHYRDGFFGLSNDLGGATDGQIQYMWTTANENAQVYCRNIFGTFLSPFEVQFVDKVRDLETPPAPSVRDVYASVTNDQTNTFNKAIYTA